MIRAKVKQRSVNNEFISGRIVIANVKTDISSLSHYSFFTNTKIDLILFSNEFELPYYYCFSFLILIILFSHSFSHHLFLITLCHSNQFNIIFILCFFIFLFSFFISKLFFINSYGSQMILEFDFNFKFSIQ